MNRIIGHCWTIYFTLLKKQSFRLFLWYVSGHLPLKLSVKRIIQLQVELGINAVKKSHLRHCLFIYLITLQYYKTLSTPSLYTFSRCLTQYDFEIQQCCWLWGFGFVLLVGWCGFCFVFLNSNPKVVWKGGIHYVESPMVIHAESPGEYWKGTVKTTKTAGSVYTGY